MFAWAAVACEDESVICLQSPVLATPLHRQLDSPSIPVLCLMDAMFERGFRPCYKKAIHIDNVELPMFFDVRDATSKRLCFRCLLILDILQANGIDRFRSTAVQVFYEVMLRRRGLIEVGLFAKMYNAMLKNALGRGLPALSDYFPPQRSGGLLMLALTARASRPPLPKPSSLWLSSVILRPEKTSCRCRKLNAGSVPSGIGHPQIGKQAAQLVALLVVTQVPMMR